MAGQRLNEVCQFRAVLAYFEKWGVDGEQKEKPCLVKHPLARVNGLSTGRWDSKGW